MKKRMRKGQVTLFIIIAIVIVAIALFIFLFPRIKTIFVPSTPNLQLKDCISKGVTDALALVSKHGGSINPVNAIMYQDSKIEYLCYTNQYYQTCINQQPLLKQHIEREILDYIKPAVDKCYDDLRTSLEGRGYSVSGRNDISVSIEPNKVKIILPGVTVTKEATESYNKIEASYDSQIYNLIMLSNSILNWEARYGDSDITTYMLYYPNVKVEKYKQEDGSKIYILTDRNTKDKFVFATRSLSWPAGYGIGLTFKPTS